MRVAIIGTGFTGLTAGYRLAKNGHAVTIIEKESYVGGLGAGFKQQVDDYPENWEWDLERYYHHWFTNDSDIFNLLKELGSADKILTLKPKTSSLYNGKIYQIDSPISLLQFTPIPFLERLRTGIVVAIFKYLIRNGIFLERWRVHDIIPRLMGKNAYKVIWEPLMEGKFADYYKNVNLAWLWARINKRTPRLAYFEGGFQAASDLIAEHIIKNSGVILTNTSIQAVTQNENAWTIQTDAHGELEFDAVIATTPPPVFIKLFPQLPEEYVSKYSKLTGNGAQVLILSLTHEFFSDGSYWLNIHDPSWPFLIVAEHTHFVDPIHYGNDHIIYVGNYLPKEHALMQLSKEELIQVSLPYLQQINPNFVLEDIKQSWHWRAPYAQPIVGVNYSQQIPPLTTPLPNVYLASMAQVYPWDRGTNYAVQMGETVARLVMEQTTR